MKRLIAVTMGLLLGASAVTASAQDYGRGRDEGGKEERRAERQQERQEQRQQAIEHLQGQDRPQHSAPGEYAPGATQQEHTQAWGRQDRGEGGRRDNGYTRGQTQGFGVPVAGQQAQDYSGGERHGRGQRDHTQSHREVYGLSNPGRGYDGGDGRGGYRDRGDRRGWDNNHGYGRDYRHGRHNGWSGRHSWRNDWHHGWSGNRWRSPSRYYYPRGHSRVSWSIGFNLPRAYYGPSYYVDYRPYGLAPPPYGYRWIRADGDILLVHLASGEVVDVLYDFFY